MKTYITSFDQLTAEQLDQWASFQQGDRQLESPFFRPEFTQAVAAVRPDVEVAIMEHGGEVIGFFPFHRGRNHVAESIGGAFNDYQGVIAARGANWNGTNLIRDCGLAAWHFNHLITSQWQFQPYFWPWIKASSPYLDVSEGFEAYHRGRKKSRSDEVSQTLRKARKLEREVGPLRFVPHTTDPEVFQTLIRWKIDQYRQWKVHNYLGSEWAIQMLDRLVHRQDVALSAMVSALYVNDKLIAVNLSLRSFGILHAWVATYNPDYRRYSPGSILLMETAKAASSLGINRIDLGRGDEPYKQRFMTSAVPLAEGAVDFRPIARTLRRSWIRTREMVRESRFRVPAQKMVRNARALFLGC